LPRYVTTMALPYEYSRKTLVANWAETRLAPDQAERDFPDNKFLRPPESDLANLETNFSILGRIARIPAHNSDGTLPDDGYRERAASNKEEFRNPRAVKDFVFNPPQDPKWITTETVPEVIHDERRPVEGQVSGYGAVLQRHGPQEGERFFETASRDAMGYPTAVHGTNRAMLGASGIGVLDVMDRTEGMKVGELAGEKYKSEDCNDPSEATAVQRSWQYQRDPALTNIHHGGKQPPVPIIDNELSLPLGEGGHRKHHASLMSRGGRLPRVTTTITTGKESKYGMSIFRDE